MKSGTRSIGLARKTATTPRSSFTRRGTCGSPASRAISPASCGRRRSSSRTPWKRMRASSPRRSSGVTPTAVVESVSVTALWRATRVPAAGICLTMNPSRGPVVAPIRRPAVVRSRVASSRRAPTTLGTSTSFPAGAGAAADGATGRTPAAGARSPVPGDGAPPRATRASARSARSRSAWLRARAAITAASYASRSARCSTCSRRAGSGRVRERSASCSITRSRCPG